MNLRHLESGVIVIAFLVVGLTYIDCLLAIT